MIPSLNHIKRVYFLGIGGIGMSAIARYFLQKGVAVSGYDKTPTAITEALQEEGAAVCYTDDVSMVDANADVVVYTPAIPPGHAQLNYYKASGLPLLKRSDMLQIITEASFNICVAGTHGKTSISTMIAHLLRATGVGCNAFLGGVSVNYHTNFWSSPSNLCVVEADEFDRSFLKLHPDVAVISSMDADHLDIYQTVEAMQDAFVQFGHRIRPGGILFAKAGLPGLTARDQVALKRYALQNDGAAIHVAEWTVEDGQYHFQPIIDGKVLPQMKMAATGYHNLENMLAAIAVCNHLNIEPGKIAEAVCSYRGVKRRFEYHVQQLDANGKPLVLIDDYAHHPEELRALITSARQLYPDSDLRIIFQPHLYTRTNDHAAGFAEVLSLTNEAFLLPIYPARELPMPGVTSEMITDRMPGGTGVVIQRNEVARVVSERASGVWLVAGAGDIDLLLPNLKNALLNT